MLTNVMYYDATDLVAFVSQLQFFFIGVPKVTIIDKKKK